MIPATDRLRALAAVGLLATALGARPAAAQVASGAANEARAAEWRLLGPARVDRRETPRVELLLKTPAGVRASELQLFANVGELELLRADGPGRWRLRYDLPPERYPRVALLAVQGAGPGQLASASLQLMGYPSVEIRSEPSVAVTVQSGAQRFGPVSTDASGHARLEIAVPPGVREVTTLATDQRGNVREGKLSLDPPPFSRLLALCAPREAAVYVIAADERGQPAEHAEFRVQASEASNSSPIQLAPGLFRVEVRAQPGTEEIEVHAELAGEERQCSLPGSPERSTGTPSAQQRSTPLLLGVQLGVSSNLAKVAGPWGALQLAYPLGSVESGFRLEAQAAYARSESQVESAGGERLSLTVDSVPLVGSIRYALALGHWQGSAVASAGLAWVQLRANRPSGEEQHAAYPLWLGGAVRAAYLLSTGEAGLELGYSQADVRAEAIRGNAAGLRASLGYWFPL